jgi:hypothetical protein
MGSKPQDYFDQPLAIDNSFDISVAQDTFNMANTYYQSLLQSSNSALVYTLDNTACILLGGFWDGPDSKNLLGWGYQADLDQPVQYIRQSKGPDAFSFPRLIQQIDPVNQ